MVRLSVAHLLDPGSVNSTHLKASEVHSQCMTEAPGQGAIQRPNLVIPRICCIANLQHNSNSSRSAVNVLIPVSPKLAVGYLIQGQLAVWPVAASCVWENHLQHGVHDKYNNRPTFFCHLICILLCDLLQTLRRSKWWQPRISVTSWNKATWRRNDKVDYGVKYDANMSRWVLIQRLVFIPFSM